MFMMPAPNMRVQRTRSSASPPHSPLTRYPLGGLARNGSRVAVAAGLATVVLVGCISYRGKQYWAWETPPGWPVTSVCEERPDGQGTSVQVVVVDEVDGVLPGVAVKLNRLDAGG